MIEYWFNVLDCQICWTNIKPFFWESKTNLETLEKLFPSIGVSYKMLFKSVKSLDRIFVAIEYWFKALECQICQTNTTSFLWENQTKLQSLQKLCPYIRVSCKFVLISVKILNAILLVMEYWFNAIECQIWLTNKRSFFGKMRQSVKLSKTFYLYWSFL